MQQYLDAVRTVLYNGTRKENRTGVDTISTFGVHYNIDLRDGFPLLTTKKINWKNIVAENLWFLSGEPTIRLLQKHGCKFWDDWADDKGRVPSAYGNFWRQFPVHDAKSGTHTTFHPDGAERASDRGGPFEGATPVGWNDQIEWVVDELKRNPMSRRLVVSAWAPGNAQTSKLPPCHLMFILNVQNLPEKCANCGGWAHSSAAGVCQVCDGSGIDKNRTKEHLCLHLTQRSADIALGVPYNIAGYALQLELFARFAGMPAGIFSHSLVDAHAYTAKPDGSKAEHDHLPGLLLQLEREPLKLPKLVIAPHIQFLSDIRHELEHPTEVMLEHFKLEGYDPHPAIRFRVAV